MAYLGINLKALLLPVLAVVFALSQPGHATTALPDLKIAFDNLTDDDAFRPREGIIIGSGTNWANGPVFIPAESGSLYAVEGGFGAIDPGRVMTMTLRSVLGARPGGVLDQVTLTVPLDAGSEAVLAFTGWNAEIEAGQHYFLQAGQAAGGSFWALAIHDPEIGETPGEFRVRDGVFEVFGPLDLAFRVTVALPQDAPTPVPVPPVGLSLMGLPIFLVVQRVFSVRRRVT